VADGGEDWCRDYVRLAVQHPREHERVPRPSGTAAPILAFVTVLPALVQRRAMLISAH
jgi:hypothetical protein